MPPALRYCPLISVYLLVVMHPGCLAGPAWAGPSMTLDPNPVVGGFSTDMTLDIGTAVYPYADVTLTSSNPAVVSGLDEFHINWPGTTVSNYAIHPAIVPVQTTVTITATWNGGTVSTDLVVLPVTVSSVTVSPISVVGGQQSPTGTVTLNTGSPYAWSDVSLTSSDPATAAVPASTRVDFLGTSATFPITTAAVSAPQTVTITASFNGSTQTCSLIIVPNATTPQPGDPPNGMQVTVPLTCGSMAFWIDGLTGNVHGVKTDPVRTRGYPLVNNINFNSQPVETNRPMGTATFSYDIHVTTQTVYDANGNGTSHWMLVDGDGTRLDFGPSSGAPAATSGVFSHLAQVQGGYQVTGASAPDDIGSAGNFIYTFDTNGKLLSIVDPSSNIQNLSYTGGNLSSVTDANSGKQITFGWTGSHITRVLQNGAVATNLTYTGSNPTSIAVVSGMTTVNSMALSYNADNTIASVTQDADPNSTINFAYTPWANAGRSSVVMLGNGAGPSAQATTNINYLAAPSTGAAETHQITNSRGGVTIYDFDANGDLFRVTPPLMNGQSAATVVTYTHNGQH